MVAVVDPSPCLEHCIGLREGTAVTHKGLMAPSDPASASQKFKSES